MNALQYTRKLMSFDGREIDAVQAMQFLHTTPDSLANTPQRQRLVRGLQYALRRLGQQAPDSGVIDDIMAGALRSVIAPNWRAYTWEQMYTILWKRSDYGVLDLAAKQRNVQAR